MHTFVLAPDDDLYPASLRDLERPPDPLWARGDLGILKRPSVAIVGTRRATAYGERVTRELARTLAMAGACVVSGLARGIDAAAHRGALEVEGATCAVLGTGLNRYYPKAHAGLQDDIARTGLLLSERQPDDLAHGGSFPNRNRIIAALAKVTIVVEAPAKSGALITATDAGDLGRTVAIVPGPIDVPQSYGSNLLMRDGATPITSMADAVTLLGLTAPILLKDIPEGSGERRMWDALKEGPADLDTLCTRTGLPAHEAIAAVSTLEVRGLIECALSGEIRRV